MRVQSNPFAKDALKESINFGQIEKINARFNELSKFISKFRHYINEKFSNVAKKLEILDSKEKSYELTYGQLTALAATQVGQYIGL